MNQGEVQCVTCSSIYWSRSIQEDRPMVQAMEHGAVEGDRSSMIVVMLTTFDVVQGILTINSHL